jgi:hypothetical protein
MEICREGLRVMEKPLECLDVYGAEHMSLLGTPLSIQIYGNSKKKSSKNKGTL